MASTRRRKPRDVKPDPPLGSQNPDVRRIDSEIKAARAILDEATERRNALGIRLALDCLILDEPAKYLEEGHSWECYPSPTGKCFYNGGPDPCHDFCLFCGEPEERK